MSDSREKSGSSFVVASNADLCRMQGLSVQVVAVLGAGIAAVLPCPRWESGETRSLHHLHWLQEPSRRVPSTQVYQQKPKNSCKKPLFKPLMYSSASW